MWTISLSHTVQTWNACFVSWVTGKKLICTGKMYKTASWKIHRPDFWRYVTLLAPFKNLHSCNLRCLLTKCRFNEQKRNLHINNVLPMSHPKLLSIMEAFPRLPRTFTQNHMCMLKDILNSNNTRKQHIPKKKTWTRSETIIIYWQTVIYWDVLIFTFRFCLVFHPIFVWPVQVYFNYAWIVTPSV